MINVFDDNEEVQADQQIPTQQQPSGSTADEMHPFGKYCLTDHNSSMQMHIHPYLTIVIDGEEYDIPSNAGIDTETCPSAMHMTHTHDNSGKLHVENYTKEDVPLEVFFDVWGKHFNETGIFDYRGGTVEMTVNGTVSLDYENHILADKQNIVIFYTSPQGE
ncbi:MAG: hypothetical protein CMB28_01260 [Euryarchaeota archaeon]|nr:hypothetical protein [Euryarchaeota archaeon]